jgi:hypothetical protein
VPYSDDDPFLKRREREMRGGAGRGADARVQAKKVRACADARCTRARAFDWKRRLAWKSALENERRCQQAKSFAVQKASIGRHELMSKNL